MKPRAAALLAILACTDPKLGPLKMPRDPENARGRLLPYLEGHGVAEARAFLGEHGFRCDAPMPSAADAHAQLCHATSGDAGWSRWTLVLIERSGRVADVQVR